MKKSLSPKKKALLQALIGEGIFLAVSAGIMALVCKTFLAETVMFGTLPLFSYAVFVILRETFRKRSEAGTTFILFSHLLQLFGSNAFTATYFCQMTFSHFLILYCITPYDKCQPFLQRKPPTTHFRTSVFGPPSQKKAASLSGSR